MKPQGPGEASLTSTVRGTSSSSLDCNPARQGGGCGPSGTGGVSARPLAPFEETAAGQRDGENRADHFTTVLGGRG